jgi:hypothetical protein
VSRADHQDEPILPLCLEQRGQEHEVDRTGAATTHVGRTRASRVVGFVGDERYGRSCEPAPPLSTSIRATPWERKHWTLTRRSCCRETGSRDTAPASWLTSWRLTNRLRWVQRAIGRRMHSGRIKPPRRHLGEGPAGRAVVQAAIGDRNEIQRAVHGHPTVETTRDAMRQLERLLAAGAPCPKTWPDSRSKRSREELKAAPFVAFRLARCGLYGYPRQDSNPQPCGPKPHALSNCATGARRRL